MKNKAEYINELIKENECESYLEIGFGKGVNFKKIICKDKTSVDIKGSSTFKGTSDDFFKGNEDTFDVIFVDGLHHADQVRKDIVNSMKCLSDEGIIILHDTLPKNKSMQEVPQKQKVWTGDCWRAAVGFHNEYPKVKFETYRADYGLTVIYPDGKKYRKHFEDKEMSYEQFKDDASELLNIVD